MKRPARRTPLLALLVANAVSISGTAMTLLALPWFVLHTTGSAAMTGLAAAAETLPLVVAAAFGAPLVDRVGARRVSVTSDLLSAVAVGAVPLLHMTVGLSFPCLLALVAVAGFSRAPGETARAVLLPTLAERAAWAPERASSAYDGVSRGARMLGAPIAGVLIGVTGAAGVLVVDALTFVVSAAVLLVFVPGARPAPGQGEPGRASGRAAAAEYLADLREGLRYLRADRLIGAITLMVMVTNLLDAAWGGVLMPVYASDVLGSSAALGAIFGVFGAGAVLGAVAWGLFGQHLPRRQAFAVAFLLVGAPRFLVFGLEPSLPVVLAVMGLSGLVAGALNPILTAVEFERVPVPLRSRVFGATTAGVLAGTPVGVLLAGVVVSRAGLATTMVAAGIAYLAATLSPFVFRVWRQMDDRRGMFAQPASEPAGEAASEPAGEAASEPADAAAGEAALLSGTAGAAPDPAAGAPTPVTVAEQPLGGRLADSPSVAVAGR